MNPKVSILVPIYGVEKFIERCAISLFEQTFDNLEYIFVNDQTKDKSIKILENIIERYPNRKESIKIINHEINKGLAGARNTAVSNASGDYILHVDSDDYLELNTIDLLYNKAISEGADIVTCDFLLEWNKTSKIAVQNIGNDKISFLQLMLSASTMVGLVNKLIKRSIYIDNNIFAIEDINLGEDFVTTPRLVYFSNKIAKVSLPLYHYIQTNSNSYSKNLNKKNINDVLFVLNYLEDFFKNKSDYDLYRESILKGKLKKKIELVSFADNKYINDLIKEFPETNRIENLTFLSKKEEIIFELIKKDQLFLLTYFIKANSSVFNLVQKLKGRKR